MKPLTIVYVTSRKEPKFEWFFDSLAKQLKDDPIQVIVVDHFITSRYVTNGETIVGPPWLNDNVQHIAPKPTIWNGLYRLTKEDWWAKSNALNTGICLCETEWIAFVDDRSVLSPQWLKCVKEAMQNNFAVCGSYEKHSNMKVENGIITDPGTDLGSDDRTQTGQPRPTEDWYGGSGALPLEWCLEVNGFSEDYCDSLGFEDIIFGKNLNNSGHQVYYDSRMRIIEDRTQGHIEGALKRMDKGISPNDKSHAILRKLENEKTSLNSYDIRELRKKVLGGEPFPPPTASPNDWFDGQPIAEFS